MFCEKLNKIAINYDRFLCVFVLIAKKLYDKINNISSPICTYAEFFELYLGIKKKNKSNTNSWTIVVIKNCLAVYANFFVFVLKNFLTGKSIVKFFSILTKSIRFDFIFARAVYYNNVEYLPIHYVRNFTVFFRNGNIFFEKKNAHLKFLNKSVAEQFLVFYSGFKSLLIPLAATLFVFLIFLSYATTNLIRQLGAWLVVGLIFFWLISGFNFFLKRYRFGKFTTAIQRFWKRANSYFWLIEGFLFSLFFYYYLNSSQEPLYYYDESNLNQTHLFSLLSAYFSYSLLVFLIFYSLFLMLNLTNFTTKQQIIHLTVLTLSMVYIYLIESYQFYYVLTTFIESFWIFDAQANVWTLEFEVPRLRAKHQYLLLALIAKYWHFLFIFLSWLFFAMKSFEQRRIYYVLFGVNIQNLIILFGLNILFYIQWFKWLFRRFYDAVYYWFFTDPNAWSIYTTFNAVYDFIISVFFIVVFTY